MRGVFVTGTDTGVGKSVLAATVLAGLVERGIAAAAFKPVVTGLDEPAGDWPPDHELLASAAGATQRLEQVAPYRFGPALSPHLAAELEGAEIAPAALVAAARAAAAAADTLVCEGVGGLLVPLTPSYLVRDLALELGLGVLVAARPGLGTINHALLTVEAAQAAGLRVLAVVMTPWAERPAPIELSNRGTVQRLARVPVVGLPRTDPRSLATAAAALPLDDWI